MSITDELDVGDGRGRYSNFQGGTIFWSPTTRAFAIYGQIMRKWVGLRGTRGLLGYPVSDEHQDGIYRRSNFQRGFIRWSPARGAVASVSLAGDVVLNPVND